MVVEPLFLSPIFQKRIWGGEKLKTAFPYNFEGNQVGECWAVSAHEHGESIVMNGQHAGQSLSELWEKERHLFGGLKGDRFPLLVKLLDAREDLSIQVHPDNNYAQKHERDHLGKTECWYILDCEDDAELIYGHLAKTKEEFEECVEKEDWDKLLRKEHIHKDEFYYVPSGTVHALCKGTLVLEIQQNSDTTYRLYDYNRKDKEGNLRELHLDKSLDVVTVPFEAEKSEPLYKKVGENNFTTYISNGYFTVAKAQIRERITISPNTPFLLGSLIEGKGTCIINDQAYPLKKGDHLLFPNNIKELTLQGDMDIIFSHV